MKASLLALLLGILFASSASAQYPSYPFNGSVKITESGDTLKNENGSYGFIVIIPPAKSIMILYTGTGNSGEIKYQSSNEETQMYTISVFSYLHVLSDRAIYSINGVKYEYYIMRY